MKAKISVTTTKVYKRNGKDRVVLMKAGDEVTIIREALPAVIIEIKGGERLSVNKNLLLYEQDIH